MSRKTRVFLIVLVGVAIVTPAAIAAVFWLTSMGVDAVRSDAEAHRLETLKYEIPETPEKAVTKYGTPGADSVQRDLVLGRTRTLTWSGRDVSIRYWASSAGGSVLDRFECKDAAWRARLDCHEAAWRLRVLE